MAARDAHGRLLLPALAALLGLPPLACSGGDQPEAAPEQGAPRTAESSGGDAAAASSTIEGPVGLRSIDGKLGAPGDGRGHVLQISAEYEVGAELPKRSGLHAKVTCGEGASRVVDVVSLASYHADFREMKAGDHKQVQTAAFWLGGLSAAPDECQLDVAYATGKKGEVEPDGEKARARFELGCSKDFRNSCFLLSVMHLRGGEARDASTTPTAHTPRPPSPQASLACPRTCPRRWRWRKRPATSTIPGAAPTPHGCT